MTRRDIETGKRIRGKSDLRGAITKDIIGDIRKYSPIIHSMQFADATLGFGIDPKEAGCWAGGMIDIPAVLREAVKLDVPIIPEYHESDYNNPKNQIKIFALAREIVAKAGIRKSGT